VLSSGSVTSAIVANKANVVNVTFNGVPASIQFAIDAQPVVNTPSTVHLTVNAADANGNAIIGPGAYPTIQLTNDDTTGTIVLAASTVNAPNAPVAVTYNGKWISTGNASANITGSIAGTPVKGTFAISPQPVFTTYPGGPTGNSSLSIAAGPDGALWFTDGSGIGRITTSGVVSTFATPSTAGPSDIVTGPDGALWFTDGSYGATDIGRLTTGGAYSTCTGPALTQSSALVSGSDGNLWVAGLNGTIVRVNPTTCAQTVFGSSPPIPEANSLALGSDGAVWFAQGTPGYGAPGYIGRITTSGAVTLYAAPLYSTPTNIATGPDGNLWYVDWFFGAIGRVTTGGTIMEFADSEYAEGQITTGPDGALWFATASGVGRINTGGQVTNYPLSMKPFGLALGSDNALWGQTYFHGQIIHLSI
jgi:streptogramin lyase